MTGLEALACAASTGLVLLLWALQRGWRQPRPRCSRASRILLWVAIAMPLLILLTAPESRPRVLVAGPHGAFEALGVLVFAGAGAAVAETVLPCTARWWTVALLIALSSVMGLGAAVFQIA